WGGEDLHAKPLLTETLKMIFWSLDWLGATLLEADELTDIADDNPLRAYVIENAPNRAVRRFWRAIEVLPPAKRDEKLAPAARPPGSTPVFIYIDEVQLFLTETVAAMLDQARKFGVHLILSHQHLGHLRERGEAIYRSVMTNTRTKIVFGGLDDDDATLMARNLYRGTSDPELPNSRYDKMSIVGQAPQS